MASLKPLEFLQSLTEERPDLTSELTELRELYNGKLWHQLSLKLESIAEHVGFKAGDILPRLYSHFVADFGPKLNQLKLARFAVKASERFSNLNERIGFLEQVLGKLKEEVMSSSRLGVSAEPCLFIEMFIAHGRLLIGKIEECKRAVLDAKETLEQLTNASS